MGRVSQQDGVLKLVRPGGIVELYKHPIKAAFIMERYPRHCVTRPDVFEFPNIVVKPESILKVGQVFYIVPYHTIYRLLKSKGYYCHHENDSMNKQAIRQAAYVTENKDVCVINNGDYEALDAVASGCFPRMKSCEASASRTGGLKPCLKKSRNNKTSRRVRFMLPFGNDAGKWDTDFSEAVR